MTKASFTQRVEKGKIKIDFSSFVDCISGGVFSVEVLPVKNGDTVTLDEIEIFSRTEPFILKSPVPMTNGVLKLNSSNDYIIRLVISLN